MSSGPLSLYQYNNELFSHLNLPWFLQDLGICLNLSKTLSDFNTGKLNCRPLMKGEAYRLELTRFLHGEFIFWLYG